MEDQLQHIIEKAKDNKPLTGAILGYLVGDEDSDKIKKALIGAGVGLLLSNIEEEDL